MTPDEMRSRDGGSLNPWQIGAEFVERLDKLIEQRQPKREIATIVLPLVEERAEQAEARVRGLEAELDAAVAREVTALRQRDAMHTRAAKWRALCERADVTHSHTIAGQSWGADFRALCAEEDGAGQVKP